MLEVDATTGKLAQRTSDAQYNSGTVINVPATEGQIVTVVSYTGQHNYTVGGTAASDNTTVYTATADDAENGYVSIVGTGTSYLYSITLTTE